MESSQPNRSPSLEEIAKEKGSPAETHGSPETAVGTPSPSLSPTPGGQTPPGVTEPLVRSSAAANRVTLQLPAHHADLERGSGPIITPIGLRRRRTTMPALIRPEGESGRKGFSPVHFLSITLRSASLISRVVNVLWPVVPAAIAVRYALPDSHLLIFVLSYIAMVPCANLVGFAGQELARKLSHVYGVIVETTLGAIVEIIMFSVLLSKSTEDVNLVPVIQAAILGSIMATMLLCLGLCFIAAGVRREETEHNEAISEVGSGLLLTAGLGLAIPTVFKMTATGGTVGDEELADRAMSISRGTAILLMMAYAVFIVFQAKTHHGIFDAIFEEDHHRDTDRELDRRKHKMTLLECIVALTTSIGLVTLLAYHLVEQIEFMVVERGISDSFMGLILVPLVEKAAEHLTAVDEAWDDQMNFALSHVMGATLQTALFNAPLIVLIGWGSGKPMGLDFHLFDIAVLILAIITVGNFLRDGKSNYLEGFLSVIVYFAIAVAAWHYPNPAHVSNHGATSSAGNSTTTTSSSGGGH